MGRSEMRKLTIYIMIILLITVPISIQSCKEEDLLKIPPDELQTGSLEDKLHLQDFVINGVRCRIVGNNIYGIIPETDKKIEVEYEIYPGAEIDTERLVELERKIYNSNEVINEKIIFQSRDGKERIFYIHLNVLPFINSWYSSAIKEDNLPEIARHGYNAVIIYVGNSVSFERIESFLNLAQSLNIMVIPQIKRSYIDNEKYEKIRKYIKRLGDHPALLGWYIYDEPHSTRIHKDNQLLPKLTKVVKIIREETPLKPIFICFGIYQNREEYTKDYLNIYDVYMFDRYPCFEGEEEFYKHRFLFFAKLLDFAREFNIRYKKTGYVFVNQGYGYDESGKLQFKRRDPTFNEYRYMIYSNLIRKPIGISNWAFYCSREKLRQEVIYPVNHEYSKFIKYIKNGEYMSDKIKVEGEQIHYLVGRVEDRYCIIVVNESKQSLWGHFSGSALEGISRVKVESENRYLNLKDNTFYDNFEPYQVHIYTFEVDGKSDR